MKKILLLHDEARRSTHLLQNAVRARGSIAEIESVAACNCDRWGHPCPGRVERISQPAPELPISMPTKK
jgi:hypothetical protein